MITASLNSMEDTEECIKLIDCWFCPEQVSNTLSVFPLKLYQQKKTCRGRYDYCMPGGKTLLNLFFKGQYSFDVMKVTYSPDCSLLLKEKGKCPYRSFLNSHYPDKKVYSFHIQSDCGFDKEKNFHENLEGYEYKSVFWNQLEFLETKMVLDPYFSPFSFEEEYKKHRGKYQWGIRKNSEENLIYRQYEFGDLILLNKKQKMVIAIYEDDINDCIGMYLYTLSETKEIKELEAMDYDECVSHW